jgi:hypothetical protein
MSMRGSMASLVQQGQRTTHTSTGQRGKVCYVRLCGQRSPRRAQLWQNYKPGIQTVKQGSPTYIGDDGQIVVLYNLLGAQYQSVGRKRVN